MIPARYPAKHKHALGQVADKNMPRAKAPKPPGPSQPLPHEALPRGGEGEARGSQAWDGSHPWFVVSLCDGIGGFFLAIQLAQYAFEGIALEKEAHLRDFTHSRWPQLLMRQDCESVTADEVIRLAAKAGCGGVWLVGGPPCQPFSVAGQRGGFNDQRANPLLVFCELKGELDKATRAAGLGFRCLLEEVATMSSTHRAEISEKFQGGPTLIHAADFGWIQRARLYWGLETYLKAGTPKGWDWEYFPPGTHFPDVGVVRWLGCRLPAEWDPDPGSTRTPPSKSIWQSPFVPGGQWRATYAEQRYDTLTTCFPHKPDHGASAADAAQYRRFSDDGGRFPLHAYAAEQCVQEKTGNGAMRLRVLSAAERERLMGYPPDWTAPLRAQRQSQEDVRCHAIGNGFHIPSILLILAIMVQPVQGVGVSQAPVAGAWRQQHAARTVFDPDHPPGADHQTDARRLLEDVQAMFPEHFFPQNRMKKVAKALQQIDWGMLGFWHRWHTLHHPRVDTGGPDIQAIRDRTGIYTATSRQKNVAGAKWTPTTRLPVDLTKEQHMEEAMQLPHAYNLDVKLEMDVEFAVEACARLGPDAPAWRGKVFEAIRRLARALAPLDAWALAHRPTRHSQGWSPALTAAFVHLLGWKDRTLPWALVEGFQVVGAIPASGVHRPLEPEHQDDAELRAALLGDNAIAYIDELENDKRVHQHAADILQSIEDEISLNLAHPLQTRAELDEHFGQGKWRPLPRHVIFQSTKARPIDDAKAGAQNAYTKCNETIVCTSSEWPAITWRALMQKVRLISPADPEPTWLRPCSGSEDMWKGFRQNHARRADEPFCVITFVHPVTKRRVYSRLKGLPFGMGSVVNQFNRLPHLKTAVLRRLLAMLACHYFDDELLLEAIQCAGSSKAMSLRLSAMWGIRYGTNKRQGMSTTSDFLGHCYDWAQLACEGTATFDVKPETRAKAVTLLDHYIATRQLTPGEASKLRGLLMWIDTGITGRPCRGALSGLIARQYWERVPRHVVTVWLATQLAYLHECVLIMPPRVLPLRRGEQMPVVLYTDAATDSPGLRIGLLLLVPGKHPLCATYDVPDEVVEQWALRTTYIGQGELLAGPLGLYIFRDELRGCDVTWYIDNISAAASLIKGASTKEDSSEMALVAGLRAAELGARIWVEWIASDQNPSDPLSRLGFDDPYVAARLDSGEWIARVGTVDWPQAVGQPRMLLQRWGTL